MTSQQARATADRLVNQDATNNAWRGASGIASYWNAVLSDRERVVLSANAEGLLKKAYDTEPKNEIKARWYARGLLLNGKISLLDNDIEMALLKIQKGRTVIEPFMLTKVSENTRVSMARILIVEGEALRKHGQLDQARQNWTEAKALLSEYEGVELPFARLDTLVLAMHHLGQKQQASVHRQRLQLAGFVPLRPYP